MLFCQLQRTLQSGSLNRNHSVVLWNADYQPNGESTISSLDQKICGQILLPNWKDFADFSSPRALNIEGIPQIVNDFHLAVAARKAIKAGDSFVRNRKCSV